MFASLAAFVLAHRRTAGVVLALVILACAAGVARLRIDFSFQSFVGSSDPAFAALRDFTEAWGSDDGVLLVLVELEEDAPGTLVDKRRLSALLEVIRALEGTDAVKAAMGLPRIPRSAGSVGVIELKPLGDLAPDDDDPDAVAAFTKSVLGDERLVPGLLSKDGRASLILAELAFNTDDILAFGPAIDEVRSTLAAHEKDGLRFLAAGIPAVRADLVHSIRTDQTLFGSLTALLMAGLLVFLFRTRHGLLIPGLAAGVPTAMLMGLLGWTGEPMGVLNQVYVTLIPVIAVADGIHVLSRFHTEARARLDEAGQLSAEKRREAIVAAYREVGTACLFTSVTTAIGFLSLGLADMVALRHFGLYAGLGIGLAFFVLVVGGPLALDRVRSLPPLRQAGGALEHRLAQLGAKVLARPWAVLAVTLSLVVALGLAGSQVIVDNRLSDTLGEGHPTHAAGKIVDEKLAGQFSIHVDLKGEPGALYRPEVLRGSERIERFARAQEGVRAVQGPAQLLAELNEALTGDKSVPGSAELAAQLLLLADMGDAASIVLKPDAARARVVVSVPDDGGKKMEALGLTLKAEADAALAGTGVTPTISGIPYVATRGFNRLSEELLQSLLSALVLIALVLGGLFRSLRIMLLSLVPNLIPLLACLALMGIVGWELAPTVAVVFTVALGIAVDDTIHLLARLYEDRRKGGTIDEVLTSAIVHTGRPVVLTSAILTVGFSVNVLSSFPVLRHFGALGATAFVSALLCDLIVLPALLKAFGAVRPASSPPAS